MLPDEYRISIRSRTPWFGHLLDFFNYVQEALQDTSLFHQSALLKEEQGQTVHNTATGRHRVFRC